MPKGASSSDFLETGVTVDETYTVDDVATKKTPCLLPSDGKTSCTTCKKSLRHISQTPLPPKKRLPLHSTYSPWDPLGRPTGARYARMHMSRKKSRIKAPIKQTTMNPTKTNQPPTNQQQPPTNNDTHDTYREHLLHGDGRRCTHSSSCTRRHGRERQKRHRRKDEKQAKGRACPVFVCG